MTTPTPRPASWRSVSLRRSAPTPRGAQRSSSPGSETSTPACPGPLPDRGRHPGPRGACAAATAPPPRLPLERPFAHATHPNDVWSIDFKGPHRRRDARRSPHRAGRGLSLPHPCQRNAPPASRSDASWSPPSASTASPRSSGLGPPSPASHPSPHGGSRGSSPSASSRDTPNRTGVSSASTAPSRRRRRRRPGSTGDGSGKPSITSGTATTTSPHEALGQRPPVRRSGPIPHASARRTTRSPCAECATTARSSGRGTESMWRVSSGRAHRPRRDERTWSIQFGPLLIGPRRPRAADRQDPGTRVTYVPGLTVTCPVAQRARAARASARRALLPPLPRLTGLQREKIEIPLSTTNGPSKPATLAPVSPGYRERPEGRPYGWTPRGRPG